MAAALARIQNPRLENDLLSAGMVRDLAVTDDGRVAFTFLLAPEDPATLVRSARAAVAAVEGVRKDEIKISVTNPAGPARATHGPPTGSAAATPPPQSLEQPSLGKIIAVSSGKGGVGKSTVAANIAVALAQAGAVAVYDEPFEYSGTTTGSGGTDSSGTRTLAMYVYEIPPGSLGARPDDRC